MRRMRLAAMAALATGAILPQAAIADDPLPPGVTESNGVKFLDSKVVLAQPLEPETYHWQRGTALKVLPPVATHICLLTKVSGKFMGAGERVALYIDPKTQRWRLNGTSQQTELMAEATCVKKIKFVPAAANPDQLTATIYTRHENGNCASHVVAMPDETQRRAFFLTGVAGKFRGGGEAVAVTRVGTRGGIRLNGCSGFVDGTLASFGDTKMPGAIFRMANGKLTTLAQNSTAFAISQSGPPSKSIWDKLGFNGLQDTGDLVAPNEQLLAPVDEAVCGIVAITGKLQGYGEFVQIAQVDRGGKKWWALWVQEIGDDATLTGAARCFSRNQFKPPA